MERDLLTLLNATIYNGKLPKAFKRYKIVTVLKSDPEPERDESYRPIIALLGVYYTLLERLIYCRISIILNASIPDEKASFRSGQNHCEYKFFSTSFVKKLELH